MFLVTVVQDKSSLVFGDHFVGEFCMWIRFIIFQVKGNLSVLGKSFAGGAFLANNVILQDSAKVSHDYTEGSFFFTMHEDICG